MASNLLADGIRGKSDDPYARETGYGFGADVSVVTDSGLAGTLLGQGTYAWGGAAGTWFWIDPKNDLVFIGMMQVMDRWKDPQLKSIDRDTAALTYGALLAPGK